MKHIFIKFLVLFAVLVTAQNAHAACSNPAGVEGEQIYNDTHNIMQFCDGNDWTAMRGNLNALSCADGQVAKWNNTGGVWQCAADNAGSGGDDLGNHTATTALNVNNNLLQNLGQTLFGPWNSTYDVWIQGGASTAGNDDRNLALLGYDEDSGDYLRINYNNEYANGTRIDGNVGIGKAVTSNRLDVDGTVAATSFVGSGAGLTGIAGDNLGSGGTTTGTVYSQNGSGYGYFGSSSANYFRFDDASQGNELYVRLGGTWEYYFGATRFSPYANNLNDLGSSSLRWKTGWFNGAVTAGSFAGNGAGITAINGDNITDGTIDGSEIQNESITSADIDNGTITAADLATNSVAAAEIAADAVGASEIAASAVRASEIQNGSIVATTELSATGTKNSSTFLRGDNTWAAPTGGGAGCSGGRSHMQVYLTTSSGGGVTTTSLYQCINGTNTYIGVASSVDNGFRCIAPGTMVLMADGSSVKAENVKVGDILLGHDGSQNEVLELDTHKLAGRQFFSINGSRSFITEDHPLMTTEGWKSINTDMTALSTDMKVDTLKVGDTLIMANNEEVLIETITGTDAPSSTTVYNYVVSGNKSYYADGHLVRAYHDERQKELAE